MLPENILFRGETKTAQFALKSNGLPVPFSGLAEVTVLVLVNKQLVGKYRKTGGSGWGTVSPVAGAGNEHKCTITMEAADTSYYWLGTLSFEFQFPAGDEIEIENPAVFTVKDSQLSRL